MADQRPPPGGFTTASTSKPKHFFGKRPRSSSPDGVIDNLHAFSAFRSVPPPFTNCVPGAVPAFGFSGFSPTTQATSKPLAKKAKPSSPDQQPEHGAFASQASLFADTVPKRTSIFGTSSFGQPSNLSRVDSPLGHVEKHSADTTTGQCDNNSIVQTASSKTPTIARFTSTRGASSISARQTPDERFKIMYESGHYSDLTICAGGKAFHVHKVVVCPWSPTFVRTETYAHTAGFITLTEAADLVDSMLRYMYGLEVPIFAARLFMFNTASSVLPNIERLRVMAVDYEISGLAAAATDQLALALRHFMRHFEKQTGPIVAVSTSLYTNTIPTDTEERAVVADATFSVLEDVMANEKYKDELLGCKDLCGDVLTLATSKLGEIRQTGPLCWRTDEAKAKKIDCQGTKQIEAPQRTN